MKIDPIDPLAFHGAAGEFVQAIQRDTEADPVGVLVSVLIMFGNAIGRSGHFIAEATPHYTNLFGILIGETGGIGSKGSAAAQARAALHAANDQWAVLRVAGGLYTGEGLIHVVRDPIYKETRNKAGEPITVTVDEGVTDKRFMALEEELSRMLKVMTNQGNILSEVVRLAWDGKVLETQIKNNRERAENAHISILGMITPDELAQNLTDISSVNGFGNRFLYFYVASPRLLPFSGNTKRLKAAADEFALAYRDSKKLFYTNRFRKFDFDSDTRAAWKLVYKSLARPTLKGLSNGIISRGHAQVRRLALIYAMLDCADYIMLPHLLAALAVWDYSVRTVNLIFKDAVASGRANEILQALRGQPNGLSRTEISGLFSNNVAAGVIGMALTSLAKDGLAVCEQQLPGGGRPASVWKAVSKPSSGTPDYLTRFKSKDWQAKLERANRAIAAKRMELRAQYNLPATGKAPPPKAASKVRDINTARSKRQAQSTKRKTLGALKK